ncbi:hypothetical protein HPB50_026932 [Hyalomma asiaticum]|uniref:Uncharacterized protein n=1 Tax=Hyalomma asiaticum TaxID=266040 RepID=A0ACB7T9B6_HYAAI|nr:hypothetical protein HPB50_026932 [Hyalomma asiaticum]
MRGRALHGAHLRENSKAWSSHSWSFLVYYKTQRENLRKRPQARAHNCSKAVKPLVTGKCGSVLVRLIPAPRGTGIVSAPVPKKLLHMAGIEDCYTSARGSTATLGNFAKATYLAIQQTYSYLTPDLWKERELQKSPYQEFTDYLMHAHRPVGTARTVEPPH